MDLPGLDRRRFLRGASYVLALPFLSSLAGASGQQAAGGPARPKRLVCVGTQLGFYKSEFFANGDAPRLIRPLDEAGLGGDFTTFSGLDHKGPTGNGHDLVHTLFTGTVAPGISLDQFVAPRLGRRTRYESLTLCAGESLSRPTLSFTATGIPIPATLHPEQVFAQVFGAGSVALEKQTHLIDTGRSLLDELRGEAKALQAEVGSEDRDKLDEYFASLRGLELELERRREWLERPYPAPPADMQAPGPRSVDGSLLLETEDLMWDLMALALKNDSTRVIMFTIPITVRALLLDGAMMRAGYHTLSHHGQDPAKVEGLLSIEERHMRGAARFLRTLKDTPDVDGGTLLDSTITIVGSAMGDAATHRRTNFPLLVAGGGFRHRRHVACGEGGAPNEMACDLFVTVLQRLGFEVDAFGSSTSDLNGSFA